MSIAPTDDAEPAAVSRQRGGRRRWPRPVAAVVAFLIVGILAAPLFIRPNPRLLPARTPADVGLTYEEVSFRAADLPLMLRAWLIPAAQPKATLVMAHGGGEDNRSLPYGGGLELMRDLVAAGYSVLALDLRNFGHSDASPDGRISFGLHESDDVIGAVDFLTAREPQRRIGAIGFSMGGSSVIYAAARDPRIEAVITDSAFADSQAIVANFMKASAGIPTWISGPLMWTADAIHGMKLGAGRAVDVVSRVAPRPILIIHDVADPIVPLQQARDLAAACSSAELWITDTAPPGGNAFGTHIKSYTYGRDAYLARVTAFLDRSFTE